MSIWFFVFFVLYGFHIVGGSLADTLVHLYGIYTIVFVCLVCLMATVYGTITHSSIVRHTVYFGYAILLTYLGTLITGMAGVTVTTGLYYILAILSIIAFLRVR
jgi:hypothetical protein